MSGNENTGPRRPLWVVPAIVGAMVTALVGCLCLGALSIAERLGEPSDVPAGAWFSLGFFLVPMLAAVGAVAGWRGSRYQHLRAAALFCGLRVAVVMAVLVGSFELRAEDGPNWVRVGLVTAVCAVSGATGGSVGWWVARGLRANGWATPGPAAPGAAPDPPS